MMEGKEEEEGFAHLCWDAALIANVSLFNLYKVPWHLSSRPQRMMNGETDE